MKIICIIPARYASTRLPGKPLADIAGNPMIEWVYHRAVASGAFNEVIIATDDDRIKKSVSDFNGKVIMTPSHLPSGTDRVAYLAKDMDADVFVNIQGDEPLIQAQLLRDICMPFADKSTEIVTAVKKIKTVQDLTDPTLVRVILNKKKEAIYFTRSIVPFIRDENDRDNWINTHLFYKHVGIYAYRKKTLMKFSKLPQGDLEKAEKLEQLRAIEFGIKIKTIETDYEMNSIDTADDLKKINDFVNKRKLKADTINEKV